MLLFYWCFYKMCTCTRILGAETFSTFLFTFLIFMFLKKCIFEELCSVAFSTFFCYTWLILSFNITHCLRQHFRLLNISTLPPLSSGTVDEDSRQCVRQVPGNIHLQWDTTHWGHPEGAGRSLLLQGWQRGGGGCHQVHPCRCAV